MPPDRLMHALMAVIRSHMSAEPAFKVGWTSCELEKQACMYQYRYELRSGLHRGHRDALALEDSDCCCARMAYKPAHHTEPVVCAIVIWHG